MNNCNTFNIITKFILFSIILIIIYNIYHRYQLTSEKFDDNIDNQKIAFLFLTREIPNHPSYWKTFFNGHLNQYNIYMHPKYPSLVTDPFWKSNIIPTNMPTKWGDISLVEATISLLGEALKDQNNQRFILVSESCLPLYNFKDFYKKLINNSYSWIHKNYASEKSNLLRHVTIPNPDFISFKNFKKQSQWMVLNRSDASFFVKNQFINLFSKMFAPDEHYFINLMDKYQRPYQDKIATYLEWHNNEGSPNKFYNMDTLLIEKARQAGAIMIRKIPPSALIAIDYIFPEHDRGTKIYNKY